MPRHPRKLSETGIYHVIVRGVNRQEIFHDDYDYYRYLYTLKRITDESNSEVMVYCLMSNHVHLLIREGEGGISHVMKRLGASYAYWYNLKYDHCGHVFQDRFKSEPVEEDRYLVTVVRYIHRNPVKAGIANRPDDYKWSSCGVYYGGAGYIPDLTKPQLIWSLFSDSKDSAIEQLAQYESEENDDQCLGFAERTRMTIDKARKIIQEEMGNQAIGCLQSMPQEERDQILRRLKGIKGISLRQVSMLSGLTVYQINKAWDNESKQENRPLV